MYIHKLIIAIIAISLLLLTSCDELGSDDIKVHIYAKVEYLHKTYVFDDSLICKHEIYRHEGDGFERHDVWHLSRYNLYKKVSEDEIMLLQLPIICGQNGQVRRIVNSYIPTISIFRPNSKIIFYYPPFPNENKSPVKVNDFIVSKIKDNTARVSHDVKYSTLSWNRDIIPTKSKYYLGYIAFVYHDNDLKKGIEVERFLRKIKSITIISDPKNKAKIGLFKKHGFLENWGVTNSSENFNNSYAMFYSYLVTKNSSGVLSVDMTKRRTVSLDVVNQAGYNSSLGNGMMKIRYKNKIYSLNDTDDIYDPYDKILIAPSLIWFRR